MKQTEIGLIPDDWEVKKLSEIGTFCKGSGISREESNTGEFPAIRYGELYTIHNDYIKSFKSHISNEVASKSKRLKQGDLLFTCSGETKEAIGKCVAFTGSERAYAGGDLLILSPTINIDSLFYGFLLNTNIAIKQKSAMAQGDAIVHISTESIGKVLVPFPPLPEQQRIAKALSDVDALISTTEKLIQKKKNIKQGTMQNLLTGKKRLPGFGPQTKSQTYKQTELGFIPEDWDVKNIKELGVFISGSGFPLIEQGRKNEKYPFFKVSDFNNLGNENKLISANNYVSETVASKLCCKIVKKNSIVFAKIGAAIMLERKRITAYDCCIDNNMMAFTVNSDNDFSYLCYNFQQIPFASLSSSTALPSLSSKIIGNQLISVPSKKEQTAIANVLSSMDKEIETLNTKLEKYRNLKTAMMQQLLTGKIRLV